MVKYIKILSLIAASALLNSCNNNTVEPQGSPDADLSDFEKSMTSTWKYLQIETEGVIYKHADRYLEPGGQGLVSTQGKRTELDRRRINYSSDKTYQLLWVDRGNYELGAANEPNWQPNFGFWYYYPETDSVIHNYGLHYQIKYKITVDGNLLTRKSIRYMSSENSPANGLNRPWQKGDRVEFVEKFARVN